MVSFSFSSSSQQKQDENKMEKKPAWNAPFSSSTSRKASKTTTPGPPLRPAGSVVTRSSSPAMYDCKAPEHGGSAGRRPGGKEEGTSSGSSSRGSSSSDDHIESFVHVSGADLTSPQSEPEPRRKQATGAARPHMALESRSHPPAPAEEPPPPPSSSSSRVSSVGRGYRAGGRPPSAVEAKPETSLSVSSLDIHSSCSAGITDHYYPGPVLMQAPTARTTHTVDIVGSEDHRRQQQPPTALAVHGRHGSRPASPVDGAAGGGGGSSSREDRVMRQEEELRSSWSEVSCLRAELKEQNSRTDALVERNKALTRERGEWEDRVKAAEAAVARAGLASDHRRVEASGASSTKIEKLMQELAAERGRCRAEEARNDSLANRCQTLKRDLEVARASLSDQQKMVDVRKLRELEDMTTRYQNALGAQAAAEAKAARLAEENEEVRRRWKADVEECRRSQQRADEKCRQVENELQAARSRLSELDLAPRSMVERTPLADIMTVIRREMERLSVDKASLAAAKAKLQDENDSARLKIRELGLVLSPDGCNGPLADVVTLLHKAYTIDRSRLQGEKDALVTQMAGAWRRARELGLAAASVSENECLADVIANVHEKLRAMRQEAESGREEAERLQREVKEMGERKADLEMQLTVHQERGHLLTKTVREVTAHVEELSIKYEAVEEERAEVQQKLDELSAYAMHLEEQGKEPPKPAYSAAVYVTFNSEKQRQYESNVKELVKLLYDPVVEIKGTVWDPSELKRATGEGGSSCGQQKVLLYVTYCPNPRLCVDGARLRTFTDLPGVTVVFIILKRGIGSQLTDIKGARDMVPCLPATVLHYGIDGEGLEDSETPAGEMNVRSSQDLGAVFRTAFPPPTPPRPKRPSVCRPAYLSSSSRLSRPGVSNGGPATRCQSPTAATGTTSSSRLSSPSSAIGRRSR